MSNEMSNADIDAVANLHARDGHLTMLTMDRFEHGELEMAQHEVVVEHLDGCGLCADRFDARHRDLPPIAPPRPPLEARAPSSLHWSVGAAGLLMAAGLILVVWPKPQQASLLPAAEPTLSTSPYTTSAAQEYGAAASIDLRLYAGEHDELPLASGDALRTDEPLRIEVRSQSHGWVAILLDTVERADAHPDEGADDTGGMEPASSMHVLAPPRAIERGATLRVRHDVDAGGRTVEERIVAVLCPEPFDVDLAELADGAGGVDAAELLLPDGCTLRAVHYVPWGRFASS
jgi:hypothetical protein